MTASPTNRPVAAFDFDGTLARRDSLLPFLARLCGPGRVGLALTRAWVAPPAADGIERRDRIKAGLLERLLQDRRMDDVEEAGHGYAARLESRLRPTMVERLHHHQGDGHEVVLVSASLAVYLRPLAARLGLDGVLAVELDHVDGVLTGQMQGPNCRGPQKVARLREWEGGRPARPLWAYGDSRGDRELLAHADHPTWVGRPRT
ncbi:MAG: HAD-IB family hydrolase [Actinomycetia bacterium]|nr:HAD-IB family hydrolase [Actinomycetes bacterium]MCP4087350.1 HAD-IB family hydrolase [Actinomycetes bacterium]